MNKSDQSSPSSPQKSPGEPSPVDKYFQQLTSIDLEYFKEFVPAYSDFDQTIVQAVVTDVFKLERSGFQCIKQTKKSPRASLPLQSDWLKLIEEKDRHVGQERVVVQVMDHEKDATIRPTKRFVHRFT
ncbi:hypothetical protein PGT21_025285 [Puccinia graminis f. sp. tritici]|uniref:Uncharacterized protein n=1 Tax=Puccinia graminis f. sp. tritici TaxID=56615 RepID=A0A5B0QY44_PUCGR|nr:hypothetical protein PGT21_025285 [Puccinia graminis f. sp. tritici]